MTNEFDAPGTYDAAAADYDLASARFWAFVSERTVGRLDLARGALVLDVPSGPGWSALAAAEAVGPGGGVVGVDLAPRMVALAREKARQRKLPLHSGVKEQRPLVFDEELIELKLVVGIVA